MRAQPPHAAHRRDVVLLIEDTRDTCELLAELIMLATRASDVVCARDGSLAIRKLREGLRPSVILFHSNAPHLSCVGFRAEQTADAELREIPVILYSAASEVEDLARRLDLAPERVVSKPAAIPTLLERMCEFSSEPGPEPDRARDARRQRSRRETGVATAAAAARARAPR